MTTTGSAKVAGAKAGTAKGAPSADVVSSSSKVTTAAQPKKRKRAATSPKPKTNNAKTVRGGNGTQSPPPPPPSHILLIDNGGDMLKYGIVGQHDKPASMRNITARLRHQWTVLAGDEVDSVQPTQLESMTRCLERGCITNLGNQVQVWKRLLDKLRIQVSLTTEAAQAFGWQVSRQPTKKQSPLYSPQTMAVVIMVSPLCPRSIMEQVFHVWFQDFQFGHVGIVTGAVFGTTPTPTECCCVVDCGWSAIQVVPTYQEKILNRNSIRRMPFGGRHLIGLWKYYCSYRQWNLMDADFLLQDLHHSLAYVSLELQEELKVAQRTSLGKRPFDREFVLPDFQTTHRGFARLTPQLQQIANEEAKIEAKIEKEAKEEEKKEQVLAEKEKAKDSTNDGADQSDDKETNDGDDEDDDKGEGSDDDNDGDDEDVDSDNETDEQRRKRLIKQRDEEERRRIELEAERQVLVVSVERFTIPEVLFHPSDAGISGMLGLPQTIAASIEACPRIYQSALYGSIRLIGGVSNLKNLQERLYRELRTLVPTQYKLGIKVADEPSMETWTNAKAWIQTTPFSQWSISRDEFETSLKAKDSQQQRPWHKLLDGHLGKLV